MQSYSLAEWTQYFHNQRGMRVEFFELNPSWFQMEILTPTRVTCCRRAAGASMCMLFSND